MPLYWVISCLFAAAVIGGCMGYGGRAAALWSLRREMLALGNAIDPKALASIAGTTLLVNELASKVDQLDRGVKSLAGRFGDQVKREKLGPADLETLSMLVAEKLRSSRPAPADAVAGIVRELRK